MKKSELKKMIRQDFASIVPDESPKVDLSDYFPEPKKQKTPRPKFNFGSYLAGIMAVIVFGLFFFVFELFPGAITTTETTTTSSIGTTTDTSGMTTDTAGTTSDQTTSGTQTTTNLITNPVTELNAQEYAGGIITASRLSLNLSLANSTSLALEESQDALMIDEYSALISTYLNVMETTVENGEAYDAEIVMSDREGYQFSILSSGVNLIGELETYRLYYNITEGNETEFTMIGIMVWGDVERNFIGKMENESGESKLEITSFEGESPDDDYVVTELKLEDGEQEYEMQVYSGGNLTLESQVEIETEATEIKVSVAIETDQKQIEFEIKKEIEDENPVVEIEYQVQSGLLSESGEIIVGVVFDNESGKYVYNFALTSGETSKAYAEDRYEDDDFETDDESVPLAL